METAPGVKKDSFTTIDRMHMRRALVLAGRGLGRVEPNPMVGCVIARGSRIIGQGYHRRFGGPHAEVDAIRSAKGSLRGSTAYVSLEPCAHHGQTPPCVDALIDAGIKRVVLAMRDPGIGGRGRGLRRLRSAGIEVRVGCLESDARQLNAPYLTVVEKSRSYVIVKWAQSLDSRISTPAGESNAISGRAAQRRVHRLRARVDGIMVGVGTALADNPRLTARDVPLRRVATRIVLDSHLRLDPNCALVRTAKRVPTLIMTTRPGATRHPRRSERLRKSGVEIVVCRQHKGRVDAADALRRLAKRGMTNVLVEGGSAVLTEFLTRRLADEAWVIVAPSLIGPAVAASGLTESLPPAASITTQRIAPDTLYRLRF